MSNLIPWDEIIELIARFPAGVSLEELMLGLKTSIPRRTLQRWLAFLVNEKKIIAIGRARARRYKPSKSYNEETLEIDSSIPISKIAGKIQITVTLPIQKRKPVGYHKEFLENYLPNTTYYLPQKLRKKLAMIGSSKDKKQLAGTYIKQIFHRLLIDLSWNSSRLEGNTYTLLETERLLDFGKAVKGKDFKETQMILNHKATIEFLINSAEDLAINSYTILNLHTLLSDNLLSDPAACGRLRSFSVGIEKSVYMPTGIPQVIVECFNLIIAKSQKIKDPFEQAFFLMVQLPYLQPFDDVNKRVSRLAANIPLISNNLCPLSFIDVPKNIYINGLLGIYELNQTELLCDVFEWAYERSCDLYSVTRKSLKEPDPFKLKYRDAIKITVREIVCNQINKEKSSEIIRKLTLDMIKKCDQARFIEIVERELQSLHIGNIARYNLKPIEFDKWKKFW